MQLKRYYSAREGGALLGFSTANPILAAIRDGRLAAEQGRSGRNGHNTASWRITGEALRELAIANGVDLVIDGQHYDPSTGEPLLNVAQAAEHAGTDAETIIDAIESGELAARPRRAPQLHALPSADERVAEPSNVAGIVPVVGVVAVPTDRYDALVRAEAELAFIRANFELTFRGGARETVKPVAPEFGVQAPPVLAVAEAGARRPRARKPANQLRDPRR